MADPIEEQVNFIIDEIDGTIAGKYEFRLRDIFEHPLDYKDRPNIIAEIDGMKDDVSTYFDKRKKEASEAIKMYVEDATAATKAAQKLDRVIKTAAKENKKPVIKPITFARKEEEDEILFLNKYEPEYDGAIESLVNNSMFVIDLCLEIDNYLVGRWIFPGTNKNKAVFVSFPINPAAALDMARDQMHVALEAVKAEIEASKAVETAMKA